MKVQHPGTASLTPVKPLAVPHIQFRKHKA
jgi:hypothetical protein